MTEAILLAMALLAHVERPDTFAVRSELQGLYDEMSQATLQFMTASEIDDFHAVLTTPDWVFVDEKGRKRDWPQVRDDAIHALVAPRPDSMTQTIGKLSLEGGDAATVLINRTIVRAVADVPERPGRSSARRMASMATFRDRWIHVNGEWKLQSRQQIGKPVEAVVHR
jgi:hypothetical protein